jgi:hypothetical protein
MPSFDQCHGQVMRALQKDGWRITEQQVPMKLGRRRVFIDLRATHGANGSRQEIALVEVKCFPDPQNTTQEIYTAVGQYILYRAMLKELEIEIPLYLSVPEMIFDAVFDLIVQRAIEDSQIKLALSIWKRKGLYDGANNRTEANRPTRGRRLRRLYAQREILYSGHCRRKSLCRGGYT